METALPEPVLETGSALGGQRPNTIPPDSLFTLTSSQIEAMSDDDLRRFLDETQSVFMPKGTPRSLLLSKLQSVAVGARDTV